MWIDAMDSGSGFLCKVAQIDTAHLGPNEYIANHIVLLLDHDHLDMRWLCSDNNIRDVCNFLTMTIHNPFQGCPK